MNTRRNPGPLYSFPMAAWFTLFFLAPLVIIVVYSFLKKGLHGGVEWEFSLAAYKSLGNSVIFRLTMRTIGIAIVSTLITILIALPCGYYMARSKNQTLLLLLIIIPFWTNFLIRVYAWKNILANNGILHEFLAKIGMIHPDVQFLYNNKAVILVLVYMYLPYAILPLYSAIDKFDFSLLEAARDLGATKFISMIKILLPNVKSGILTAILFTFIPIFGQYAVPDLVGGKNTMLGKYIADQLKISRNWPLASAISVILTTITTAGVILMLVMQKREADRAADVRGAETRGREALI